MPIDHVEADEPVVEREERAREPRHRARHHERDEFEARRVVADRTRPLFVVAHRGENQTEGRTDDPKHEGKAQRADREHDEIEDAVVLQAQPGQRSARPELQAVLAAGEIVPLKDHEILKLGERQRDHRKIDAGAADRERADHERRQPRIHRTSDNAQHWRKVAVDHGNGRHVRGAAPEHCVTERQQSRESQQQIERDREERVADQIRREHG